MLRQAFTDRLKQSMKAREMRTASTTRISAELKGCDVAARGHGNAEGLCDIETQQMLQVMIKRPRESITLCEQVKRPDLAQQEREEIAVIQGFRPDQLDQSEIEEAVVAAIGETEAAGIKDMGRGMRVLRERHDGVIEIAQAGVIAKRLLS
jgi:uncharacterized protein YqeY